jgi:putative intracellular protease/amidase
MPSRILFVFTSTNKTLTGAQTGWYLPEAAHPYYVLNEYVHILAPLTYHPDEIIRKHTIDFASPKGPNPEVDEHSVKLFTDDDCVKFLQDPEVKQKFANAKKLSEVDPKDYDAIFYVGG